MCHCVLSSCFAFLSSLPSAGTLSTVNAPHRSLGARTRAHLDALLTSKHPASVRRPAAVTAATLGSTGCSERAPCPLKSSSGSSTASAANPPPAPCLGSIKPMPHCRQWRRSRVLPSAQRLCLPAVTLWWRAAACPCCWASFGRLAAPRRRLRRFGRPYPAWPTSADAGRCTGGRRRGWSQLCGRTGGE